MPNHVHGVVQLYGDSGVSLGQIIRAFKGASTRTIRVAGIQDFGWQANYYEHVIRNDHELERIRNYIISNPLVWPDDPENPEQETKGTHRRTKRLGRDESRRYKDDRPSVGNLVN